MNTMTMKPAPAPRPVPGFVYCYLCTHTVPATVLLSTRARPTVQPGQKCERCAASIDSAAVVRLDRAA